MKYICIFTLFFMLKSYTSYTQKNELNGIIIDYISQTPIKEARIYNGDDTVKTDSSGRFIWTHTSKEITIDKQGYLTQRTKPYQDIAVYLTPYSISLNPIIISANREEQKRSSAPLSISSLSQRLIEETKADYLGEVLNKANGVFYVDLGNEQHSLSIRQPISYGSVFSYVEDGIPIRPVGLFNHNALIEINHADIQNIEIIRGPASSIYGSDAVGGVVNFLSTKPSPKLTAKIHLQGNGQSYLKTNGLVSKKWKKFGFVSNISYTSRHANNNQHRDFSKIGFSFKGDFYISPRTQLNTSIDYINYKTDMTGTLDSLNFATHNLSSLQTFTFRKVKALRFRTSLEQRWNVKSKTQMTFFIRDNSIKQNPHYRIKNDFKPWNGKGDKKVAHGEINNNTFQSYGLLLQHKQKFKFCNIQWINGLSVDYTPAQYKAWYIKIRKDKQGKYINYLPQDSILSDYRVQLINTGVYTHLSLNPIKKLFINLGLRYDRIDYIYDNILDSTAFSGASDSKNYFHHITPKVGLIYDFGKGWGLYANYAQGFSPPEVGELYRGVKVPRLLPSTYHSYEIGGWMSLEKQKIKLEVVIYQMNGQNEIVSTLLDDGTRIKTNAGKTRHRGIEYQLNIRPIKDLNIRFGGTNAEHKYIRYVENGINLSEKTIPLAPKFIANGSLTYYPRFFSGFRAELEWQHVNAYFLDAKNKNKYNGFNLLNIRIGYKVNGFDFWFKVLNMTNERYATVASESRWGKRFKDGQSRTFRVGMSYSFVKK